MRTNIVLNDELFAEAARYAVGSTRRAVVEEALRSFVEMKAKEQRLASYARRAREIEERVATIRLRQSPTELLREDRQRV